MAAADDDQPESTSARRPRRGVVGCLLRLLFTLLAMVMVGAATLGAIAYLLLAPGPLSAEKTVVVPRGASVEAIGRLLDTAGSLDYPELFEYQAFAYQQWRGPLRAGEYALPANAAVLDILHILREGKTVTRRITVAEGLTTREILGLVELAEGLEGTLGQFPAEGELLPETYHYSWGDSRSAVVGRMRQAMRDAVAEAWKSRIQGLPLSSSDQLVTLAAIVEKETGVAAERPRVAAVFLNRLRRGMKLQSDPTVIYGLTRGQQALDRGLTRADLQSRTAYNTYVIDALPPGPIANPGRASLQAVARAPVTDELYFVADGSGGHVFAKTLDEHNKNVAKWREIQRQRGQR